jgi:hypothetical protein
MIGDSAGTIADFCVPCSNELWGLFDTNATIVLAYTAATGDRVTSINCHCSTTTSVNVPIALYTYNTTTDSLMVKVGEDSVTCTSTWGIRTKTVSWDLTASTTYGVARLVKGAASFRGVRPSISYGRYKAGTSFPDPYGVKGTNTTWRESSFLLGSNFSGAAASLSVGGNTTIGGGVVVGGK